MAYDSEPENVDFETNAEIVSAFVKRKSYAMANIKSFLPIQRP
jgi:hypothetical protein